MDAQLSKLLAKFKAYFEVQADGRVCCLPNGHCFPPRYDVIDAFINGKRFPQLKKIYDAEQNLSQFEPYIVVSKNFPTMLYCTLTGQLLEKSVAAVKRHMSGRKYTTNKAKHDAKLMELKPEPDIDDVMGVKPKKQKKPEGEDGMDEDGEEGEGEEEDGSMDEDEDEEAAGPLKKRMRVDKGDDEDEEAEEAEDEEAAGAPMDEDSDEAFEFGDAEPGSSGEEEEEEEEEEKEQQQQPPAAPPAKAQGGKKGQRGQQPKGKQQGSGGPKPAAAGTLQSKPAVKQAAGAKSAQQGKQGKAKARPTGQAPAKQAAPKAAAQPRGKGKQKR